MAKSVRGFVDQITQLQEEKVKLNEVVSKRERELTEVNGELKQMKTSVEERYVSKEKYTKLQDDYLNLEVKHTDSMVSGVQSTEYLIGQKFVGQKCRNFSLVSNILYDETFCPLKILSNISIQKSGKNQTKLSKFRLGVEKFVRHNILSVENFVRRNFVR